MGFDWSNLIILLFVLFDFVAKGGASNLKSKFEQMAQAGEEVHVI